MVTDDADESETIEIINQLMAAQPVMPPIGPDGTMAPVLLGEPDNVPEATPESCVCLRGPCAHLMEFKSWFPAGNPTGSLDHPYKQVSRYCLSVPTKHIDLTDELIMECGRWRPLTTHELNEISAIRQDYYSRIASVQADAHKKQGV